MKVLVLSVIIFLLSAKDTFAQVVINEFSSWGSSDDWVEIYAFDNVDISGWVLRDTASTIMNKIPSGILIGPSYGSFYTVGVGNRLNRNGDIIKLLKDDDSTLIDEVSYGDKGGVCTPGENESVGRYPDGNSTIERFAFVTKGQSNNKVKLNPCVSPTVYSTPEVQPVNTEKDTPKGVLKIGDVKSENGEILHSVKIYIDEVYIHHYAPEELTFCDDCKCDTVLCGFGAHNIKLVKDGLENWIAKKVINSGDSISLDAVMQKVVNTPILGADGSVETTYPTRADIKSETVARKSDVFESGSAIDLNVSTGGADYDQILGIIDEISAPAAHEPTRVEVAGEKVNVRFILFGIGGILFIASATLLAIKKRKMSYNIKSSDGKSKKDA